MGNFERATEGVIQKEGRSDNQANLGGEMKIGLYNLEPKLKNLALDKLRIYHQRKDDEVEDYFALKKYDKVYCSSLFTFTPKDKVSPDAICGGTGFDLETVLPNDIEQVKPHKNYGFTTRGCPRRCKFCVVPKKEGDIRAVGHLGDLWDSKSKEITLFDNNILALPEHFRRICNQARAFRVTLDFNQGLDHRYLTQDIVDELRNISHKEYRFAFDHIRYQKSVDEAIELLQSNDINRCTWYVLVGFDSDLDEDLTRLNHLKSRNQNAFVQRYNYCQDKKLRLLARWANQHHIFHSYTWQEFLEHPKHIKSARNLGLI